MNGRVRAHGGHQTQPVGPWRLCATPAGACDGPEALARGSWTWHAAASATTVAAALRAAGTWSLDGPARRFDAEDWWWTARLPATSGAPEIALALDGLATVVDAWLDGAPLLSSENMFLRHERVIARGGGELHLRFRALDALLAVRRPRPRWRTPMVEHQQLRWFRTTLLGRTPGWSPPAAAVGPWRGARLEERHGLVLDDVKLRTRCEGDAGVIECAASVRWLADAVPLVIEVQREGESFSAPMTADGRVRVVVPGVKRWWPHTHGEPAMYSVQLRAGDQIVDLGRVGFRTLEIDRRDDGFRLVVNDVPVFCRGACWTPLDPVSLTAPPGAYPTALAQARDAGMNMLRVGGTMVYETDDFFDAADAQGILIWQDFMFANMDFPEDPAFVASAVAEARQALAPLQARPCLAVLCGNSEGEQQAAMWGAGKTLWQQPLFTETLPQVAAELCPDVPTWPSSAHGGAFPHAADAGTTSYYGVGAYLRPLEDARRAGVRFASECLAFANIPSVAAVERIAPGVRVHHPAWKARTPRDLGAGWDFDDVRDHYVRTLFRVDPAWLRYADHERFLALGRVATGEVMAATFGEWRRAGSLCGGALVWFLRDLWDGAGWGVVDAAGAPKAAYRYLARALAPRATFISDEGNNGLHVHVINDTAHALEAELALALWRDGDVAVGAARRDVTVPAHSARSWSAVEWLDGFVDLSYAFRFGAPPCDLVVATLAKGGGVVSEAFHFPLGVPSGREADLGLAAELTLGPTGDGELVVRTRRFAQSLSIDLDGFRAADDFFHLQPGGQRRIRVRRLVPEGAPRGTVQALNGAASVPIKVVV